MAGIKFGTDGWRSIMAEDFTFLNVRRVTRAVAGYLAACGRQEQGVVVGYDCRFLSEQFAAAASEVLAKEAITVFLTEQATPTPVTAFAVLEQRAAGALMFTASHNPPEYNGIKFIPHYAGPALPDITGQIEDHLRRWEEKEVSCLPLAEARQKGLVQGIEPREAYFRHLAGIIDLDAIHRAGLRVVVDPMHGCGVEYLEEFLRRAGAQVTVIRQERDAYFGGALPDPTAENLSMLQEEVRRQGAHLGLALDGDADRFGVVDRDGTYFSPNQALPMLLYHLVHNRGWRGQTVARTVATTHLLDRIAAAYGMKVAETAVGFKYIGQALRDEDTLLGGEESGGMSVRGHLPEKDGILAGTLLAEMVATGGRSLGELWQGLQEEFGPVFSSRLDLRVEEQAKEATLQRLTNYAPSKLNGQPVVERLTVDGIKLVLADGSWVLIRPSGTEPLFRLYSEAATPGALAALAEEVRSEVVL